MPATLLLSFPPATLPRECPAGPPGPTDKAHRCRASARALVQYRPPRYAEAIVFDVRDPLLRDCLAAAAFNSRRKFHLGQTQFLAPARDELAERLHPFVPSRFVAEPPDLPRFLFFSTLLSSTSTSRRSFPQTQTDCGAHFAPCRGKNVPARHEI